MRTCPSLSANLNRALYGRLGHLGENMKMEYARLVSNSTSPHFTNNSTDVQPDLFCNDRDILVIGGKGIEWRTGLSRSVLKHCSYCGQTSPDDARGGCAACGAPRGKDVE